MGLSEIEKIRCLVTIIRERRQQNKAVLWPSGAQKAYGVVSLGTVGL